MRAGKNKVSAGLAREQNKTVIQNLQGVGSTAGPCSNSGFLQDFDSLGMTCRRPTLHYSLFTHAGSACVTLTAAMKPNVESGILYWDGSRLRVGRYTGDGKLVSLSDVEVGWGSVIYTQGGSVVGFTTTSSSDTWTTDDVKFNPTTYANSHFATWANIPRWSGDEQVEGYLSTSSWHYTGNVKNGRGDICKLADIAPADVKSGAKIDNGVWRLPTNFENVLYTGTPSSFNYDDTISPYMYTFQSELSLPALSGRDASGVPQAWGTSGEYWSSSVGDGSLVYQLQFSVSAVIPSEIDPAAFGRAIRCVLQNPK